MAWEVEGTDEFADWFTALTDDEQTSVGRVVELLVEHGPSLPFPYSSGVAASRHRHKTGNDRWYETHVPVADALYDEYLAELEREGLT